MEKHYKLSDTEFEKQFETAALDVVLFSHEAHLRLAWIHVTKYGVDQAIRNVSDQILHFVKSIGAENKFNKTLTVASVRAINHFVQKSQSDNFQDFITEFPRLKYNFKDLLGFHYAVDIFNSDVAKKEYVEPDLLPFE